MNKGEQVMEIKPAVVVTINDLKGMLVDAGKLAAKEVLAQVKGDVTADPKEQQVKLLQLYIEDRNAIEHPEQHYASGMHIRMLKPNCSPSSPNGQIGLIA